MDLFWERGDEAAGLNELLQRMQISRQSLYDTFGDKRQRYLGALGHYSECVTQPIVDRLQAGGSPLENTRRTLPDLARPAPMQPRGVAC